MGIAPIRSDMLAHSGQDIDGYALECAFVAGALPWIMVHMEPAKGSTKPPKPTSGLKVLGHVRRVHLKRFHHPFFVPLTQAVQACDGLCKQFIVDNGPDSLLPHRKEPLTNEIVVKLLGLFHSPDIKVGRRTIDPGNPAWASLFALFHTCAQTGFRKAEVSLPAGTRWTKAFISFDNLRWCIGGKMYNSLTPELLARMTSDDYCLLRPPPSKSDPLGLHWGACTIYLRFSDSDPINAARMLAHLEILRAVKPEKRADTPLFVNFTGTAWGQQFLSDMFRSLLVLVLDDPSTVRRYPMHSWRMYLACALMGAGASNGTIQQMLRWRSDEALKIYARINDYKYADWLTKASQAKVSNIRTTTIVENMQTRGLVEGQRHAAFYDSWLQLATKAVVTSTSVDFTPIHDTAGLMTQLHHAHKDLVSMAMAEDSM
jgi:hypothetical protein